MPNGTILRLGTVSAKYSDIAHGALANVGFHVCDTTVANILKAHGIEPGPQRQRRTSWQPFLNADWDSIAAANFTTVEVWTRFGTGHLPRLRRDAPEDSLRCALEQFSAHFHRERNHQGLDNRIIDAGDEIGRTSGELQCRERLAGMLRYYYRDAA